jgi:phospholipid/cholesterol/gamma-HCH transport system substrate-binding protein
MGTERKSRTELLVGLFLFASLAILGILIVTFGRVGQGLQAPYEITVLFPNANGLAPGADVTLSGAKIGFVDGPPQLLRDSYRVAVRVQVQGSVRIPRKSRFLIGSAGLLGDKFVDVVPAQEIDAGDFWQPKEIVDGSRSGGFDELAARGAEVMDQLNESLKQIQALTTNINQRILNESNTANLQQTFQNLRDTSASVQKSALSIDRVLGKTDQVLATADSALKHFEKLAKNASDGKGALGVLSQDKQTGDNLRTFIANLRRSGILFYKDRPVPPEETKEGKSR